MMDCENVQGNVAICQGETIYLTTHCLKLAFNHLSEMYADI